MPAQFDAATRIGKCGQFLQCTAMSELLLEIGRAISVALRVRAFTRCYINDLSQADRPRLGNLTTSQLCESPMTGYPQLQLYVGGKWTLAEGKPAINPADESVIATVPTATG